MDLELLRNVAPAGRIYWRLHALERFLERGITRRDVILAIMEGDVIEDYPDDEPYPSCLILMEGPTALHVVAALDRAHGICHVITAYLPDPELWDTGFRVRRRDR